MLLSSCSGRNPIGRRTESNRTANGIRSDGERNPIGRRTESDWTADGNGRGCSCLSCTNKANRQSIPAVSTAPTKPTEQSIPAVSARLCRLPEQELHQPSQQNNLLSSNIFHSDTHRLLGCVKIKRGFIGLNECR